MLNVVDDGTREFQVAVVEKSISGARIARELAQLVLEDGKATTTVSDNDDELTSNTVLSWASRPALTEARCTMTS